MQSETLFQPHLGEYHNIYKPESNMGGYLALAKVLKFFPQTYTAEVQIIKTNAIVGSVSEDGKYGARILTSTAHYDEFTQSSSGEIQYIQEGQLVIVAFLDGLRNQPIILGSLHNTWNASNNVLPDSLNNDLNSSKEKGKYVRVFPSQAYYRVSGDGGMEVSLPNKTFLKIDTDGNDDITDAHEGFDHKDLLEKDPLTYNTRSGVSEETMLPSSVLLVHRSSYMDEDTTWTKFFIDKSGKFRATRDPNDGTLSYMEVSETGSIKIRRQLDSNVHEGGSNHTEICVQDNGDIIVKKDGEDIISINGNATSVSSNGCSISLGDDTSIIHSSGSRIRFTDDGDIVIEPKRYLLINDINIGGE